MSGYFDLKTCARVYWNAGWCARSERVVRCMYAMLSPCPFACACIRFANISTQLQYSVVSVVGLQQCSTRFASCSSNMDGRCTVVANNVIRGFAVVLPLASTAVASCIVALYGGGRVFE